MVGPAQVEGMVGDDHIDAALDGLLDDGGDRVDRQEDRADGLRGIAADELVGVPGLGELGRAAVRSMATTSATVGEAGDASGEVSTACAESGSAGLEAMTGWLMSEG